MTSSPQNRTEGSAQRRSGRWQLVLLLALVIGPMLLATAMFYGRFWIPEDRSYHGELIGGRQSLVELGVPFSAGKGWQLLVSAPQDCAAECQQLIYLARQIHIGLGRDASRANHALALASPLSAELNERLQREYPQLLRYPLDPDVYARAVQDNPAAQLWIVDPLGNLVLRYPADANGKQILNDLRHLLKLSNIG
ncbi:hypothetical protein [Pseudomonas sp. N040]|uniref:hypothetical protein n=1 Tax=Pseudomonas sp. N040 TaxID=2785325 RepID=UPI0018A2ED3A|nr:hypothetical protein [Pseudomonas sp. N040]MBF7728828.1 hypothetical protein [Pseudomonas sp. N040]MBW7012468.1 hypothetical protein [Pseudomonas sp. N040]